MVVCFLESVNLFSRHKLVISLASLQSFRPITRWRDEVGVTSFHVASLVSQGHFKDHLCFPILPTRGLEKWCWASTAIIAIRLYKQYNFSYGEQQFYSSIKGKSPLLKLNCFNQVGLNLIKNQIHFCLTNIRKVCRLALTGHFKRSLFNCTLMQIFNQPLRAMQLCFDLIGRQQLE